jgi:hypothetical protein
MIPRPIDGPVGIGAKQVQLEQRHGQSPGQALHSAHVRLAECSTLRSVGWFGRREHAALGGSLFPRPSAQWDLSYPQGTSVVRVARRVWRAAA